jgi:hypothetical protein
MRMVRSVYEARTSAVNATDARGDAGAGIPHAGTRGARDDAAWQRTRDRAVEPGRSAGIRSREPSIPGAARDSALARAAPVAGTLPTNV